MGMILLALVLLAASVTATVVAASPLFRTLSTMVDCWADEVQGRTSAERSR